MEKSSTEQQESILKDSHHLLVNPGGSARVPLADALGEPKGNLMVGRLDAVTCSVFKKRRRKVGSGDGEICHIQPRTTGPKKI